jgi:sugar phosphate isomerase/epimerase
MHLKDFKISKIIGGYQILGAPIGEGDQDCASILKQALRINPDMEVCIELGMAWPEEKTRVRELEEQWVETSVRNTKAYLETVVPDV